MIRYRTYIGQAAQGLYGNLVGVVYAVVAVCDESGDVGHAVLHCPIPGDPLVTTGTVPYMLSEVHVLRHYRRRGIARYMVTRCLAYAHKRGIPVELRATSYATGERMSEEELVAFYKTFGFEERARINGSVCMRLA